MTRKLPALLLSTAFALAACQNNNAAENNMTTAEDLNAVDTNMAATDTNAVASTIDSAFLTEAMKGDNSEVALGQLAASKASSKGVKDLGTMLATDHGAHKKEVAALAQQAGIPVTDDLKDEAKTLMTKLQGLSGDAFDKAFVDATIEDHKKDIAAYEKESEGNGQTAAMALDTLPTLKKHLETAQSLAK